MADMNGRDNTDESETPSIFDLFEPPPEPDPSTFGKVPVVRSDDDEFDRKSGTTSAERKTAAEAEAAGLQHWTAPATGQVPKVLGGDEGKDLWGDVKGPSWQSDDPTWSGPDLADVFAGSDDTDIGGDNEHDQSTSAAPTTPTVSTPPAASTPAPTPPRRSELDDWAPDGRPIPPTLDTSEGRRIPGTGPVSEPAAGLDHSEIANHRDLDLRTPVLDDRTSPGHAAATAASRSPGVPDGDAAIRTQPRARVVSSPPSVETHRSATADTAAGATGRVPVTSERGVAAPEDLRGDPRSELSDDDPTAPGLFPRSESEDRYFEGDRYDGARDLEELDQPGGRNLPQAIGAAVVMAGVVLAALWIGPAAMMVVVCAAALLAVIELYNAMRLAGLRPATLLGLLATVGFPAAAYLRGDVAFTVIMALSLVFGMLWYLAGADHERPVLNLSLTILGVLWIGGCGAFAALILRQEEFGVQLLLSTILIAVVSDTMAYFGGRAFGRRPFHSASPNKTWEGTMTGFVFAVFCAFAVAVMPFSTMWDGRFLGALALGAVVGIMTPMGDLAESLVKRDLGVKDMGTIVPGHGGLLDRIDGILFALPGAYFLAVVVGIV